MNGDDHNIAKGISGAQKPIKSAQLERRSRLGLLAAGLMVTLGVAVILLNVWLGGKPVQYPTAVTVPSSNVQPVNTPMATGAMSLADARRSVSFPVYVPVYVPAGMGPEPAQVSAAANGQPPAVRVFYHTADGRQSFRVFSSVFAPGDTMEKYAERMATLGYPSKVDEVTLPNGLKAYFAYRGPDCMLPRLSLDWAQGDSHLAVSAMLSPQGQFLLSRDEMIKIAASMSPTADTPGAFQPGYQPDRLPQPVATASDCLQSAQASNPDKNLPNAQETAEVTAMPGTPLPERLLHSYASLDDLRSHLNFAVFVPTDLLGWLNPPANFAAWPDEVDFVYEDKQHGRVLYQIDTPATGKLLSANDEVITLANGTIAHFHNPRLECLTGTPTLYWEQNGARILFWTNRESGYLLSKSELLQIANSVSASAPLNQQDNLNPRPAASPLPSPHDTPDSCSG